jgi:hypothetical protein
MLIVFGNVSCKDYLDREPESIIGEKEVFKNFTNFQGFVEEMYMLLPDIAKHTWCSSFNWGDDEQQYTPGARYVLYHFDRGNFRRYITEGECFLDGNRPILGTTRMDKQIWGGSWYGIRKANLGIDAMEKGLMVDATQEERDMILGQLYYFRGFFHFQLMQYWGAMPYIDKVLGGEKLDLPRPKYNECADKAGEDLRKAADLLPINWDNTGPGRRTMGNNELRANKIWALAYLGKNYLYAGSPLMTHGAATGASANRTYDVEFCKKAAAAFAEIIDLVEKGQTQYKLVEFANYSDLFYTYRQNWRIPGSTEAIVRSPSYEGNSRWRQSESYLPGGGGEPGGLADAERLWPAANYVNMFGMKNGLPLDDPDSKFSKTQPWKDRDPRFYYNFIYDGVKVIDASLTPPDPAKPGQSEEEKWRYANLFTGGSYRTCSSPNQTGYCTKKFILPGCNSFDKIADAFGNNFCIMLTMLRLADVYLMYAEAAAQGYASATGKDSRIALTAVDAVDKIRARAGVDPVHSKFKGSLDAFMPELRRERAVELAFESHRFNDLRRWLLFTEEPYTIKTRQEFDRAGTFDPANTKENQVTGFREEILWKREYDSKHYWLPIKDADVYLYEGFQQNPGW